MAAFSTSGNYLWHQLHHWKFRFSFTLLIQEYAFDRISIGSEMKDDLLKELAIYRYLVVKNK